MSQYRPLKKKESFIAKCYIFFLPLRMLLPLSPVFGIFGAQAEYFDFIFLILGCIEYIVVYRTISIRKSGIGDRVMRSFLEAVIVCTLLSIIMTLYIFFTYGNYKGNSCFIASGKMILNFVQYAIMIAYSRHILSTIPLQKVLRIIHASIRFLLIIGIIQGAVKFGLIPGSFYTILANILNLTPRLGEISLTVAEPSHAAMIIGIIILPFYFSKLLHGEKFSVLEIIELILWYALTILCESSTAYAILGVETAVILIWLTWKKNTGTGLKVLVIFLSVLFAVVMLAPEIIDSITGINFSYLLFNKMLDLGNQSTASRYLAIYANLLIFIRFPLFGCANGLQGYFYENYRYILNGKIVDESTLELFTGSLGSIANGTAFFAGILSGWGLVGLLLFVRFFIKSIKSIINQMKGSLYFYFYCIAFIGILFSGIKSEYVGIPFIWFVLSIPTLNYEIEQ